MPANEAGPVLTCKNDAVARRAFKWALKDNDPRDFRLYKIGMYEPIKMTIVPLEHPYEITTTEQEDN